jgi:hypothetical protein
MTKCAVWVSFVGVKYLEQMMKFVTQISLKYNLSMIFFVKDNNDIQLNTTKKTKKNKRKIDTIETEQEIETPIKSAT